MLTFPGTWPSPDHVRGSRRAQQHVLSTDSWTRRLTVCSLPLPRFPCQSMKWCDEGIYLLASQPVDKCQSQDGAEAALQEIEKFLETGAENKIPELSRIYQDYESILTRDLMVSRPGLLSGSSPVPSSRELPPQCWQDWVSGPPRTLGIRERQHRGH